MTRWEPVLGWEEFYEVSDDGQVRRLDYVKVGGGGSRQMIPAGPVSTWTANNGYINVTLERRGRKRTAGVHALIAEAFLGARPGRWHHARHLDGDRTNNTLPNIAWGSPRDNAMDTLRHGRHEKRNRTHCSKGHPYDEVNTHYRPDGHRDCKACAQDYNARRRAERAARKAAKAAA